jgi:hypothetical protein
MAECRAAHGAAVSGVCHMLVQLAVGRPYSSYSSWLCNNDVCKRQYGSVCVCEVLHCSGSWCCDCTTLVKSLCARLCIRPQELLHMTYHACTRGAAVLLTLQLLQMLRNGVLCFLNVGGRCAAHSACL